MLDISSETYPQRQPGTAQSANPTHVDSGAAAFANSPSTIFTRPTRIVGIERNGAHVTLRCESAAYLNAIAQTHETRMFQMTRQPEPGAAMDIELTFWSAAVFRVRFGTAPIPADKPIFPEPSRNMLIGQPEREIALTVTDGEISLIISTESITLEIKKDLLTLAVYDAQKRLVWSQRRSDRFTSDILDISTAQLGDQSGSFEAFALTPDEAIYGLGERFDQVQRRGIPVDFWNKDAIGTDGTRTYINAPFLFSTRGYGLFVNSAAEMDWQIGTTNAGTLGFGVADPFMDYFFIYGPTPAAILYRYSQLTGFAALPPIWSFGLWMSRNSYESWAVVDEVAKGLREREIPTDVLHLDTYWFKDDWNCDLKFDSVRFAEPEQHMAQLRAAGFRISLWQYNFVPPRPDNQNFVDGKAKGYFARSKDGELFAYPEGTTGSWVDDAIIDFSNPAASRWYADQIKSLIRMGAAAIKTDFGEGIPTDAVYQRIDGSHFHNLYSLVYNSVVADAVHEASGERIVWARSGTAGSQRYPIHWNGDSFCSWGDLAGTLRSALSLGLTAFPFFAHDIGGFIGKPDAELYVRWAQFGLFSSHSRCHGAGNDNSREPWAFGEEASAIFKRYTELRYRLLPYIYQQAIAATRTAKPIVRALVIDYPEDRNTWHLDNQYLFGDSFLVAPILQPLAHANTRAIYLPEGLWYDYWTKEAIPSHGQWLEQSIDLDTMPLYVRAGSMIPYGQLRQSTFGEIGPIIRLEAYAGADSHLTYDDGATQFEAELHGAQLSVSDMSIATEIISPRS